MTVTDNQPVSVGNLRAVIGSMGGGVLLLDQLDPACTTGEITLSQSVAGFKSVEVVLGSSPYNGDRLPISSVRLPHPDGKKFLVSFASNSTAYEMVNTLLAFDGSKLTVSMNSTRVYQVYGYR